jgi:hypothetical protein
MTDLEEKIEELQNKGVRVLGMRVTGASGMAAFALISTLVGGLYAGFLMYQKVEAVAGLDLGEYQQAMDVMDAKVTGIVSKVDKSVEYSRDIKNGLRDDIASIEKQTDRVEDMVRKSEEKVRLMIDAAEIRFESKRDRLRTSQAADLKDLEGRLQAKLQRALDNPLAK